MAIQCAGVSNSQQGLGRRISAGQSVPVKPYPMTVVYSAYIDAIPNGVYQTFFAFGPETFSGGDYYTTAIVGSVSPSRMSVGADGSDTNTGADAPTGRWMRHGLQCFPSNSAGTQRLHRFYYDLPTANFVDHESVVGSNYFSAPSADAFVRVADTWWATGETLSGRMAGFKMWQTILPPWAMWIESLSPFPVLPKYAPFLWCCIPLRTATDAFDLSANGRNFFVGSGGTVPTTIANPPNIVRPRRTFPRFSITADLPPSFAVQPTDQDGVVGGTATFSTTVTGPGSITYQWQKSADGNSWSNVSGGSGDTSDDYTTPTIVRSDGGAWYRLQATNAFGTTNSNRVMLRVTDIPTSFAASVGLVIGGSSSFVGYSFVGANDAVVGGGTTRGMPFGEGGTAFNGGRVFVGPIH